MFDDLFASLSHLNEADREALRRRAIIEPYAERSVLVHQGTRIDGLMLISTGRVAVQAVRERPPSAAGEPLGPVPIDVSVLGPGDLLGEMSFCTGDVTSASAVGIQPGTALRFTTDVIAALMREDVGFGQRLYASLAASIANRLRNTTARLPALIVEDVAQVRHHHTTLSGRIKDGAVPAPLLSAIEHFKQGMLDLDRKLAQDLGRTARGKAPGLTQGDAAAEAALLCDQLTGTLAATVVAARDSREADGIGAYALRETFGYFMRSRFADRSFSKPRGYAGDYYTIELVYDNQPAGDGRLGPLIDRWFLRRPAGRAVRARRPFLRDVLLSRYHQHASCADDSYRVLSIGSGAARELLDLFAALPDAEAVQKVRATCLDIDVEALAFSNQLAQAQGVQDRFQWTRENVISLGQGQGSTRPAPQNVIYSAGLFDYLNEEQAVQALNWIHGQLAPRGLAVIGNFDQRCADRALLDHILDWRLLYRSADEMLAIFQRSAFSDSKLEVRWEESGTNLFLFAELP